MSYSSTANLFCSCHHDARNCVAHVASTTLGVAVLWELAARALGGAVAWLRSARLFGLQQACLQLLARFATQGVPLPLELQSNSLDLRVPRVD